jgi:hypothetical protein
MISKNKFVGLNWIHRALNGGQWHVFMKMVKRVMSQNNGNSLSNYELSNNKSE